MHTAPDKDKSKVSDIDQVIPSPNIEYQEPDYGTGSVGPEPEEVVSDTEEDVKGASKKNDSEIEPDSAPEPALGTF